MTARPPKPPKVDTAWLHMQDARARPAGFPPRRPRKKGAPMTALLLVLLLLVTVVSGVLLWVLETTETPQRGIDTLPGVPPPVGSTGGGAPPDYDG